MNDLRSFVVLQARLYEFLEQQDETTLQAIVSGAVQLAVLRADDARAPASSPPREDARIASRPASDGRTMVPSRDPLQVAQDLSRLTSEHERRIYLNAAELSVKGLQKVAKLRDLVRYSKLTRAELINLLVGHGLDQTDALAGEARTPARSSSYPVDGNSEAEQEATTHEARPSTVAPATATVKPNADVAAIASRLRETETEEEGAAYLHAQHLDRESLLAVAAELQLTRVDRLSQTELEKRVLKQAIGARRKFTGLRRW
jgi:hypothetical protein